MLVHDYFVSEFIKVLEFVSSFVNLALAREHNVHLILLKVGSFLEKGFNFERPHEGEMLHHVFDINSYFA